ncbi:MAG: putative PEP-CTERM system TPR-repeat lipoprotein, partial [Gammaproteobacteria bacterium]
EVITALKALLRVAPDHTSSLIELGEALAKVGEREQAVNALKRATRLAPDNRRAQLMLAAALVDSGNHADAVATLKAAEERVPDDPRFQALLGHLYLREGDQAKAIDALEKASALNPEVGVIQAWLGGGYLRAGRIDSAVDALEKASRIDPSIRNSAMLSLAYARDGRIGKGIAQAKAAIRRAPDDPLAHFLYGVLLAASKDAEGARNAFDEALRLDPSHLWTRLHLARAMFASGQREPAIASLAKLREQHESALPLVVELGRMYLRQRQVNNSVTLLEPFVEGTRAMQPRLLLAQAYSLAQRPTDAFRVLEQTDQMHPNNPIVAMAKARSEIVLQNWSDAERTLTPLAALDPVPRAVALALANVQLRLGKATHAVLKLEAFLDGHPDDLAAKLLLGQAKLALGEVAPARALVTDLERAAPEAIAVLVLSASVSLAESAFASALKTFRRASQLAPGGRFIVGEAHALRGLNKPKEARSVLEKWLESHPEDIPVQRALGELALRANESDDAIARYDTILTKHPNDIVALNNAAWLLLDRQPAKAREFAERAFNLRPEHPAVLDTYGWVLANTGNPQQAIRHLRKAVELMKGEPGHRYRLALAYSRADDRQLALQQLDEILDQTRAFPERDDAKSLRTELRSRR